jgi:mobilome CxxCx(11)CxxC protein
METEEQRFNKLRNACWDKSFHSFALGYIFDKKAQRYGFFVNMLKVFGIIVPTAIGATAIGYGLEAEILKYMIVVAIPLTISQLIFSVVAVTNKWDDKLAYAYEASQDLNLMYDDFKKLGNLPPKDFQELNEKYELLNTRYKSRAQQNSKQNIKEWEQRMGMRFALRETQKECVGCHVVPVSMESTECNVCGKFEKSVYYKMFKP